jgi:hypothetical protein
VQFVQHGAHFLENHDEQRIAALLSFPEHRAAALLILGLPGLCLLHEGQLTGARNRLSVHLERRRFESEQADIFEFYGGILKVLQQTAVGAGQATLLRPREAWSGNPTHLNFVAVQWRSKADSFEVVLVNLAPHDGQCYLDLQGDDIGDSGWLMSDLLGPQVFEREGSDLKKSGLYLDVPAHGAQILQFVPQPRMARVLTSSRSG